MNEIMATQALSTLLWLIVILAVFLGFAYLMKRMKGLNLSKNINMQIIGGISLGSKERLVVVRMDNKKMVLGVTSNSITNLYSTEVSEFEENEIKEKSQDKSKFKNILSNTLVGTPKND